MSFHLREHFGILHSLPITAVSHDGRGLGFLKNPQNPGQRGQAVFVKGALPGQTVSCAISHVKKSFLEADLCRIEENFADFQHPHCPHQSQCGGCSLQPLPYEKQLFWKEQLTLDAFVRIGKFSLEQFKSLWRNIIPSPHAVRYRNKVEFAFGENENGEFCLGFRKRFSHEVVSIENCALVPEAASQIKTSCEGLCRKKPASKKFLHYLLVRHGLLENGAEAWWAILRTAKTSVAEKKFVNWLGSSLLASHSGLACFIHEETRPSGRKIRVSAQSREAETGAAPAILRLPLGQRLFALDAGSFFQVNGGASQILANLALDMAPASGAGLLDLYCGVGAPGLLLADRYEHCLGIEADKTAIACARLNSQNPSHSFLAGDAGKVLEKSLATPKEWSTALLDPPRAGLDARARHQLLKANPEKIIYISCNPPTMARDAAFLEEKYSLTRLAGLDMFPHTPHVECCGLLERKN